MHVFNENLEDTLLTFLLRKGPQSTPTLLEKAVAERNCTRQGFYRALRKLRDTERVVIYRSLVSVNEPWARKVRELFGARTENVIGNFSKLEEGENLVLTLSGLTAMDRLWTHLFSIIDLQVPKKYPLYLYNPHNWSALLRQETDIELERELSQRSRAAYLVVGSASALNKTVTKSAGFRHLQSSFNPRFSSSAYIATVGEYLIEVTFSPKSRKEIDHVFRTMTDEISARKLLQKLDKKVRCKIVIKRDAKKTLQWERRIGNDFHFRRK